MRYEVMVIDVGPRRGEKGMPIGFNEVDPGAQKKINQYSKEGWSLKAATLHHPQRVWSLFFERALSEA